MNAFRIAATISTIFTGAALAACSADTEPAAPTLFDQLSALCGQAFEGGVVTEDERDADFASQRLVMHVRDCEADTLRIPFHVGEDRSRTWVVTRLEDDRLRLKHDHRHEDGSEDVLTQYGGETVAAAAGLSADFPADEESRALFVREGIEVSMANVWTLAVDGDAFVYALNRPDRHFEARFDLTRPVAAPPAPWGAEG
ncbi:MAG: hypothetical protein RIA71_14680 [Oceanicaulis sp.]